MPLDADVINQDCYVCKFKLPEGNDVVCGCDVEICSACAGYVSAEMCGCRTKCDSPRCFFQFLQRMPDVVYLLPEQISGIPIPTFIKEPE